jgi:hypothetical protein
VRFVAIEPGPKKTDKHLTIIADEPLSAVPRPEIIMCPAVRDARAHDAESAAGLDRTAHETSQWTTSVCTGSLLLGAAGLLQGLEATTHWTVLDELRALGARPTSRRVVEQGKIVTAAACRRGSTCAPPRRTHRGGRDGAGDSAWHRVRSAAAVRRRLSGEGPRRSWRRCASAPGPGWWPAASQCQL